TDKTIKNIMMLKLNMKIIPENMKTLNQTGDHKDISETSNNKKLKDPTTNTWSKKQSVESAILKGTLTAIAQKSNTNDVLEKGISQNTVSITSVDATNSSLKETDNSHFKNSRKNRLKTTGIIKFQNTHYKSTNYINVTASYVDDEWNNGYNADDKSVKSDKTVTPLPKVYNQSINEYITEITILQRNEDEFINKTLDDIMTETLENRKPPEYTEEKLQEQLQENKYVKFGIEEDPLPEKLKEETPNTSEQPFGNLLQKLQNAFSNHNFKEEIDNLTEDTLEEERINSNMSPLELELYDIQQ
ncbi:7186_t:CDS:2, partial [Racocetra fulgida]